MATPPMVGVPRLTRWRLRAVVADLLAEPAAAEVGDDQRSAQDRGRAARTRRRSGSSSRLSPPPPPASRLARGEPTASSAIASATRSQARRARRLHQHHVAGPQLGPQQRRRAASTSGTHCAVPAPRAFQSRAVADRPGRRADRDQARYAQPAATRPERLVLGGSVGARARPSRRAPRTSGRRSLRGDGRPARAARPASTRDWRCRRR